jgi:hypothetical protein
MTDKDNKQVTLTAQPAEVKDLIKIPRPINIDHATSSRIIGEMKTVYIRGTIIYWMIEADKDIHIAFHSLDGKFSIVCEIPDPTCLEIKNSLVLNQIKIARQEFLKFKSTNHKMMAGTYEITGILFYDKPHHAIGANDKHLELHPVIQFKKL